MVTSTNTSQSRLFPPIQPDLYSSQHPPSSPTPDRLVAQKILALAHQPSGWKDTLGLYSDPLAHISALLRYHRLAMEAELKAQWERADFFWKQVQEIFQSLSKQEDFWSYIVSTLGNEPGLMILNPPEKLQQRIVDELLIETHIAFYYGQVQQAENITLEDRAFVHLDYLENLLNLSTKPEQYKLAIVGFPWMQKFTRLKKAHRWKQAIKLAETRLKYFPNYIPYQNELAEVHCGKVFHQLERYKTANFKTLIDPINFIKKGINQLRELANLYPQNPIFSEYLGSLYYQSAIQYINKNQFSEAYVSLMDAVVQNPLLQVHVSQLYQQILKIIEQLNRQGWKTITDYKTWSEPMTSKESILNAKLKNLEISLAQFRYIWAEYSGTEIPLNSQQKSPAILQRQGESFLVNFT